MRHEFVNAKHFCIKNVEEIFRLIVLAAFVLAEKGDYTYFMIDATVSCMLSPFGGIFLTILQNKSANLYIILHPSKGKYCDYVC
ncbi:hypothetical protein EGR_06599 [Echinococcus granulosus]|uniref:Uncharacterized protein n=1 Tax=Echinococcus granulosus TaxID=6210 RepID=W6UBM9_ECHGR|nr:hypothetical protein EGR_06599 [Echinococcus granulosus]EUB58510.1 hypothetical protein EGR_06599 [Echinococcus granulosus]